MQTGGIRWRFGPELVAASLALVSSGVLRNFTCDDAAISYRFAEQFAAGHPLGTVTPGDPIVSGFSNPTWTALLAGAARLGLAPTAAAKVLGIVCFVTTSVLVVRLVRRLTEGRGALWAGAIAGASSTLGLWSMSGLENSLVALLVTAIALAMVREEQDGLRCVRATGSVGLLSALVISRPDGFVFLAAGAVACLLATGHSDRRSIRKLAQRIGPRLVVPASVLVGWWLLSLQWFGDALANTVYAKASSTVGQRVVGALWISSPTNVSTRNYFVQLGAIVLLPLAACAAPRLGGPTRTVAVLAAATFVLPFSEADWMLGYRFYAITVPLLVVLAAIGVDQLLIRSPAPGMNRIGLRRVAPVLLVAVWLTVNLTTSIQLSNDQYPGQVTVARVRSATEPLAEAAERFGLHDPLVMTADAGATVNDLDLRILDMAGLLDPQISHLMDGQLPYRWEYAFAERSPDLIRAGDEEWSWNLRWGAVPGRARIARLRGHRRPSRRELRPTRPRDSPIGTSPPPQPRGTVGKRAIPSCPVLLSPMVCSPSVRGSTAARNRGNDRVRFTLQSDGSKPSMAVLQLGATVADPNGWRPDEEVLHVAHLSVPAGSAGRAHLRIEVGREGSWTTLDERSIDIGRAAVLRQIKAIPRSMQTSPVVSALDAVGRLQDLQDAAPSSRPVDRALEATRAAGLRALRLEMEAGVRTGDLDGLMRSSHLIGELRGRSDASADWKQLASTLRGSAQTFGDEDRFHLLAVAAKCDPTSGSIQRELRSARLARPAAPPVDPDTVRR